MFVADGLITCYGESELNEFGRQELWWDATTSAAAESDHYFMPAESETNRREASTHF